MLAGRQDGGAPDTASLRHRHQSPPSQRSGRGLEGEICPSAIGTAIADPTQNVELSVVKRSIECHVKMVGQLDIPRNTPGGVASLT
jgi:hypothetical protein